MESDTIMILPWAAKTSATSSSFPIASPTGFSRLHASIRPRASFPRKLPNVLEFPQRDWISSAKWPEVVLTSSVFCITPCNGPEAPVTDQEIIDLNGSISAPMSEKWLSPDISS
jgi:hypothetical protein